MHSDRRLLAALFTTGLAALAFEVLWSRALIPWIGGTAMAQVMTVAVYMFGLFLGAMAGIRFAERCVDPRQAFIRFEAAVAALCSIAILGLPLAAPLLRTFSRGALLSNQWGAALRGVVGGFLMLPATFLMGLSFPLAIAALQKRLAQRNAAALAYGVNTLGATLGTCLGGFFLVPQLGVRIGVTAVALLDLLVLFLTRNAAPAAAVGARPVHGTRPAPPPPPPKESEVPILLCVLIGGLSALGLEVLLFRLLGMLLGPTARAFTVVLACYVFGLGIGALAVQPLVKRSPHVARAVFVGCWIFVGVFCLALHWMIATRPDWLILQDMTDGGAVAEQLARRSWLAFFLLTPLTIAFGASYPSAVAAGGDAGAARAARIYAFLTLGNILGLLVTAFFLFPGLGMQGSMLAFSSAGFLAPLPLLLQRARNGRHAVTAVAATVVLAALPLWLTRDWNFKVLNSAPYMYRRDPSLDWQKLLLYLHTDFETTVAVVKDGDTRLFTLDGKADGSTTRGDMSTQSLLGVLPAVLHPDPRIALVVGLGTGQTAAEVLRLPLERVDCAELSPAVVKSLSYFEEINHGLGSDRRFRVLPTDGRTVLRFGTEQYDLIISEPSNVWVPGVAHLFTREAFEEARGRLNPDGGIFLQWLHAYLLDAEAIKSVVRTIVDVFPYVTLWNTGLTNREALFVAGFSPLEVSIDELDRRLLAGAFENHQAPGRPFTAWTLLSGFVAGTESLRRFGGEGPRSFDSRPRLEYAAEAAMMSNAEGPYHRLLVDLLETPESILRELSDTDRDRLRRRVEMARELQRILGGEKRSNDEIERLASTASDYPEAQFALGEILCTFASRIEPERPGGAKILLDTALRIWPELEDGLRQSIRLAQRTGDSTAAWELLGRLDQCSVKGVQPLLIRGDLLTQSAEFDKAIKTYRQALFTDQKSIYALAGIAQCYQYLRDGANAVSTWNQLLDLDPGNTLALESLARLQKNR